MNVLYLLSKIVTCPGTFMRGFWEHAACRLLKIEVTERRYFSNTQTCGHAAHAPVLRAGKAFWLAFLPWLAQRLLGWVFTGAGFAPLLVFGLRSQRETSFFWLEAISLFLGLSLLCNSFGSWDDAKQRWKLFYGSAAARETAAGLPAKILLAPANVYFLAGAALERCAIPAVAAIALAAAALAG